MTEQLSELGFYALAGGHESPALMLDQLPEAEAMGLGSAFIGERFDVKEALTLSGAAAAATKRLGIATAATSHNTRHPISTAAHATTMHRLSGGRYTLGLGRGVGLLWDRLGVPRVTSAQLEDVVGLMRRLWHGETVIGHDGPAGKFPVLHLDSSFDEDIPIGYAAFGPKSMALGGRVMDMVVLHTFFTDEAVERCVRIVREEADKAGRDPAAVRIWSCYATVPDGLPEAVRLKKTVGRLSTYLRGYGDLIVKANDWDPAALTRFLTDPEVAAFKGTIDRTADPALLAHIAELLPSEWFEPMATGSPQECAERVLRQFDLGVDGVIMHGATPAELAPVVEAYRTIRPAARFDHVQANPGRSVTV